VLQYYRCLKCSFVQAGKVISVVISTLYPSIAILALFFISKLLIRIIVIIVFSLMFGSTLAITTNARPVEIIAATAACASVQVVFVGSTSVSKKYLN